MKINIHANISNEEESEDNININQDIKWIKSHLQIAENKSEWLAYKIFYNDNNLNMQRCPLYILIYSNKELNKSELVNKTSNQIFDYFNDNIRVQDLKSILNMKIDMDLQKYCFLQYNQYNNYRLFKQEQYINNYNFCSQVKQYIYAIIGEQMYNLVSMGFKRPYIQEANISIFDQVLALINLAIEKNNINTKIINLFTNDLVNKSLLGLSSPMLYLIQNESLSKEQNKINYQRQYEISKPITVLNKQYLLYNNISKHNFKRIKDMFIQLNLI